MDPNKHNRLADFQARHKLGGVLLTERPNFAWITDGRCNRIANNATAGVTSILATSDRAVCLANDIEAPRMIAEELAGTGIETITFPWWDAEAATKAAAEAIGPLRVATDGFDFGLGLPRLPADFAKLRWSLTPPEIARYRHCGHHASAAMEAACRAISPGMTEHEIAGELDQRIHAAGLNPVVTLIAADDRIFNFRHPIATPAKLRSYVMLVTCAEYGGLISCLTRFVSFGPMNDELRRKQHAVCAVDAAVIRATRPGRRMGDVFADLTAAYARHGYGEQWKLHHQGGSTGYANREIVATPGCDEVVLENQAFAWNASITGVKSEDTVLVTSGGQEVLTPASAAWPKIDCGGLARPDVLVR